MRAREDIERWKPIPGFGGVYEAGFDGRIRRVKGQKQGIIQQYKKHNVMCVHLTEPDGRRREKRVPLIVAQTWMGEKPGRNYCIFHKNGIPEDNFVNNLEYITRRELGRRTGKKSSRRAVLKLSRDGEILEIYRSARAAAKAEPFGRQTITDCCNGRRKKRDECMFAWEDSWKCQRRSSSSWRKEKK